LEHDPEKCEAVFRIDHAQTGSAGPASARRRRKSNRHSMSSREMKMPADLAGIFIGQTFREELR
ncbi:hypothetical protein, partial [Bradyrhizobium brasilense]|uniref:hypothetical protein n=1 Tax=Bradyrhizobium brasilense TaxID=1419277 RepID=UPI001E5D5EED